MSTEQEPTKQRYTCPNCGNNVSAPPEDVVDPVDCPHCGQAGMFTLALPKEYPPEMASGDLEETKESKEESQIDSAAAALAASEFSQETPVPESSSAHTRNAPPRRKQSAGPPRRGGDLSPPRRDRPGYRRHAPKTPPPAKQGISLLTVFLAIVAVVLSIIILLIMIPKDLNFIQGYPAKTVGSSSTQPRNLLAEVQQVLGPQDQALAFTEAEVNAFLNNRVKGTQRGPFKGLISFKGAYADFEKDRVEFYIERTVMGIPFTMSMKVTKARFEHKTTWRAGGGSIGKFGLSSRQFKPIIDAFRRLGVACEEELDAVTKMKDVRFEKDKVILIPMLADAGATPATGAPAKPPAAPEPKPETEPTMESGDPAMESGDPAMESGDPAMESDDPAMESDDPAMESDDPAMESDDPAMESGDPATAPEPKPDAGDDDATGDDQ